MPVNFDDAIPFFGNSVAAMGPEHPKEKIREICVWIYQPRPDGKGDVAATEMTTTHDEGQHPHFVRVDGTDGKPGRWLLPLKKVSDPGPHFKEGRAFAIAVALVEEEDVERVKKQRVAWWSQQVELQSDEARVKSADKAAEGAASSDPRTREQADKVLRKDGALAEPLAFRGL